MTHPHSPLGLRYLYVALLLLLGACARQGAPTGGPQDTRPPAVDTTASTPNFSTRFDKKRIELKFDEWVVLADAATQVVVSPPLAKRPEVVLKGRTVVLTFDKNEVLRPNTTYTINYGTAVKDLHEGNAAKDLRFVFSTGDFIDSLGFQGVLTDAFTGEAVENMAVLLHENPSDTAVRKERPYYFSRTDKAGQFEFRNLRAGTFQVVAIDDADQNLKWDGESERIAFKATPMLVSDTPRAPLVLKLFKNRPKFRLVSPNTSRYGLVKVGFSHAIDTFDIQTQAMSGLRTLTEKTPDSLMFWYDLPVDTTWNLLFSHPDSLRRDTILVKKLSRSDFLKNHRIDFGDVGQSAAAASGRGRVQNSPAPTAPKPAVVKTVAQVFSKPAVLPFNFPIVALDTARWLLTVDSNRVSDFTAMPDARMPRQCTLSLNWKQGKTYTLRLLPGAISDFWGEKNADTLVRVFNILPEKQLGTLSVTLEKIRPGTAYVLQILNGTLVEESRAFRSETDTYKLTFNHLPVATYSARLLEDLNGNGRWDTGDYPSKRQPEKVYIKKLESLRANWELEVTFSTEPTAEKKRNK